MAQGTLNVLVFHKVTQCTKSQHLLQLRVDVTCLQHVV